MPTIRSTVHIENRFGKITEQVNQVARQAVQAGATVGAHAAAEVAAQRTRTGRMAEIRVESARGAESGWEASFVSPVGYAWFQNYGTLDSRDKPLKQPSRGARTGEGVHPLHFLDAGRQAGRKAMRARIRQGL